MDPAAWLAISGPDCAERIDCRDRIRTDPERGHSRDRTKAVFRRGTDVDHLFARFARVRARSRFCVHRAVCRRHLRDALLGHAQVCVNFAAPHNAVSRLTMIVSTFSGLWLPKPRPEWRGLGGVLPERAVVALLTRLLPFLRSLFKTRARLEQRPD